MSTVVERPQDFADCVGRKLGTSDWMALEQAQVDTFAALTGDRHWIHVDTERARLEMPEGKTIVHGFLVLSLIPMLQGGVFQVKRRGKGLNYGCNRIRFTSPVPVGSRVRLHQTLLACQRLPDGVRLTFDCTIEIEGRERPALVAETMVQMYDE